MDKSGRGPIWGNAAVILAVIATARTDGIHPLAVDGMMP
jgi:hypothetical protein